MADTGKTRDTGLIVFVLEGDEPVRDAIAMLLDTAGVACKTFDSAGDFLAALDIWPERNGCLVCDSDLPGMSGLDLQDELNKSHSDLPVVFITDSGDVSAAVRAMKGGAVDFLRKPLLDQELLERVTEALELSSQRRERRRQLDDFLQRAARLSGRESEVFERVADGQANKAIAIDLGISERTVEIHRSRVMKKMLARNLPELVRMRIRIDSGV